MKKKYFEIKEGDIFKDDNNSRYIKVLKIDSEERAICETSGYCDDETEETIFSLHELTRYEATL